MFDFFTDDSFDIEKTKQYILSIQVSLDGFSFLIFHQAENRVVAFKNTPLKISSDNLLSRRLKEWLELESILKKPFKIIRIFVFTKNFSLVPEEFTGNDRQEELTSVLFNSDENNKIIENKIESLNASLVFPLPSDSFEVLQLFFNNIEIIHPVTKLLSKPAESIKKNCATVISTTRFIYLIVYRNNKLLLANSFQTGHQNDLVYNVINTFQQLEISRSETDLYVAGLNNHITEIENLLKPYFENIKILKPEGLIPNQNNIQNTLLHYLTLT